MFMVTLRKIRSGRAFLIVFPLLYLCPDLLCQMQPVEELDKFVAFVNGEVLLKSDIDIELNISTLNAPTDSTDRVTRDAALERLINRRLLVGEAKRFQSSEITPAAVEYRYGRVVVLFGGEEVFLARCGMTREEFQVRLRDQMLLDNYVQMRIKAFVSISESQIDEYIERHRTDLEVPESIRTLDVDPGLRDAIHELLIEKETNNRLNEIISRLKANASIVLLSDGEQKPL